MNVNIETTKRIIDVAQAWISGFDIPWINYRAKIAYYSYDRGGPFIDVEVVWTHITSGNEIILSDIMWDTHLSLRISYMMFLIW